MKRPSDFLRILLVLAAALCGAAQAATLDLGPANPSAPNLFAVVPSGDPTYAQLQQLARWGYLPKTSVETSLTRYEVADLILRARRNYDESKLIRVAQAELDLSEPETIVTHHDKGPGAASASTESGSDLGLSEATAESAPQDEDVQKAFTSLQQAYEWELDQVKSQVKDLQDRVAKLDAQNYKTWKQVRSLSTQPSISLHGFGRANSLSTDLYGPLAAYPVRSTSNYTFLDLVPTGIISKELRWDAIIRLDSNLASGGVAAGYDIKRISIQLNPSFISATMGDFDLAWTPFTLWNRDCDNDYMYTPGILDRFNQYNKYPSFLNQSPLMPLRGVRLGTSVMWPNSKVLDSFKIEAFNHMLRSGYSGGYIAHRYTGWVFGAMTEVKAKKYLTLGGYGVLLDEPLNTDNPTASYKPYDASTWAQQYRIGSLTPKLDYIVNDDFSVGAKLEAAGTQYLDDKENSDRKISDWSAFGGPCVRYKESTLSFNYLNVGYGFYSPLAQTRQRDDLTGTLMSEPIVLSSNIAKDALGRPSAIFKYYNRLYDNVFPYGMATPNRKGFGADFSANALDKNAFSFKGMVYAVKEITDNFVVNKAGTSYESVDETASSPVTKRKFVYVNLGPKINLASLLDLKRRLDAGINVRHESTKSDVGTLNSTKVLLGVGAGIARWWEIELSGGVVFCKGREAFLDGVYARTAYPYDNTDLGQYVARSVDGTAQLGTFSMIFKIDRHSLLVMDAMLETDSSVLNTNQKLHQQTLDLNYEITF